MRAIKNPAALPKQQKDKLAGARVVAGLAYKAVESRANKKEGLKFPRIAPSIKLQIPETANRAVSFYFLPHLCPALRPPPPLPRSFFILCFQFSEASEKKVIGCPRQ